MTPFGLCHSNNRSGYGDLVTSVWTIVTLYKYMHCKSGQRQLPYALCNMVSIIYTKTSIWALVKKLYSMYYVFFIPLYIPPACTCSLDLSLAFQCPILSSWEWAFFVSSFKAIDLELLFLHSGWAAPPTGLWSCLSISLAIQSSSSLTPLPCFLQGTLFTMVQ